METIAFYSYKGGVGRSLLLANAARFLATLGKGVVALDFDFEAPGLHYKLGASIINRPLGVSGGAVPYLVATADGASSPPSLERHIVSLAVPPGEEGWLTLMPAGPAPKVKYWAALKELGEKLHLGDSSGQGVMALLDLQGRIASELKPDYLLIDARTGITELGGLATTILADTVVCMFAANQESLDGTVTVVEALKAAPRLRRKKPIRVVPVLSRASQPPSDERFANGVKRLLELAAPRRKAKSKEAAEPALPQRKSEAKQELFALPHDDAMAASERVVGGERKASAFSPLYKAYLELFQSLFPTRAEPARRVLERLEAINDVKEELTKPGRYEEYERGLSPWTDSAIQDGVVYEAVGYGKKGSRYADLVCRDDSGSALMVVEYLADGSEEEAVEFWGKGTKVRCAVLLLRTQGRYVNREIYTRPPNGSDLHKTERWELPRPQEFELLADVGDESIDSMLEAVRRGQVEAVPWLINEWIESLPSGEPKMRRRHRSRPERARRILDGLAATEDVQCAEEILRRASGRVYGESRRHRRMRDDFDSLQDIEGRMAADFYAPLFWRLPVEAAIKSMRPKHYPGETPPLAAHWLLAHRLMGLQYDPFQNSIAEARALAARIRRLGEHDNDDDFADHMLHRSRRDWTRSVVLSTEAPPILVWEEVLREDPFFRGNWIEANKKVANKVNESLGDGRRLRGWLRAVKERGDLATFGLLGGYNSSERIDLYVTVIDAAAEVLGMSPRHLKSVVFIQLSAWAIAHQARDLDSHPGYGFTPPQPVIPFNRESPTHVTLIQAFTDRLIHLLQDPNLLAAFERLSEHQPNAYRHWSVLRTLPLEELRVSLLRARASATALGLPEVIDAE
jgi:MinD-like ATPase involved in chromosome partitioning or flagellar assembly